MWLTGLSLLTFMGCGTAPGGGLALFPDTHRLLDVTKQLRQCAPQLAPVPRELQKSVIPEYIIEPGDVLLVEPVFLDSPLRFPADQTVLVDGTIDLGRFGRLPVVGMTVEQAEEQIMILIRSANVKYRDELLTNEQSEVNVRLMAPNAAIYYVLGEVNSPGFYPLIGRETVLDAILTAGGLSDRASKHKIVLTRASHPQDCRTVLPVCWDQIVQIGDSTTNYQIMPGDRIFVATETCTDSLCRSCCRGNECGLCERCQCTTGSCPPAVPPPTTYGFSAPASPSPPLEPAENPIATPAPESDR
jgi:protein involved in polysaccharide export with SLBB domain